MVQTIGNPVSWAARNLFGSVNHMGKMIQSVGGSAEESQPLVRQLSLADLREVLSLGYEDFKACRSDVITICTLYPIIGICLAYMAFHGNAVHLIAPLISGFALLGPVAALGMYEMSRRREAGLETNWLSMFDVIRSPSLGAILVLAVMSFAIFFVWLSAAHLLYIATIGTWPPDSVGIFLSETFGSIAGWTMIIVGTAIGFLFALAVLMTGIVSFPLLLDRKVSAITAVMISVKVVTENPVPALAWGLIVAISLMLGSIPLLLGLAVVLPVLGHATWHLYRKAVA